MRFAVVVIAITCNNMPQFNRGQWAERSKCGRLKSEADNGIQLVFGEIEINWPEFCHFRQGYT
jgi:hypothetical protein